MRRYRLKHKPSGALLEISAGTFWQACVKLGYKKEDCIGVRLSDRPYQVNKHYRTANQSDLGD